MTGQNNPAAARVPLQTVLASIVGLWLCYFLLVTLRGVLVGFDLQDEMLWRRAIVVLAGVVVTIGMWLALRIFDASPLWIKVLSALLIALPASVLIAQANQSVFASVQERMIEQMGERQGVRLRRDEAGNVLVDISQQPGTAGPAAPRDGSETMILSSGPQGIERWRQLTDIALGRYFLLLAWAALYLALLEGAQARAAERRESQFRQVAKAAELRSLRYQVNPHFLFNTLNSLSSLVMTGKTDQAEEMIQAVSRFYRHSLADAPTADVPLVDEFALQRHYLEIEMVRFPDRLQVEYDLPSHLEDVQVPGLILQPLVENSVKYAVAPHSRPVRIRIAAREEFGRLVLSVHDDGPGHAGEGGMGIGLTNVRDRLSARYGNEAQFATGPTKNGYRTEIRMPMVKNG